MALSLAHGRRVTLSKVDAFADGVAVKSVSPSFRSPIAAYVSKYHTYHRSSSQPRKILSFKADFQVCGPFYGRKQLLLSF